MDTMSVSWMITLKAAVLIALAFIGLWGLLWSLLLSQKLVINKTKVEISEKNDEMEMAAAVAVALALDQDSNTETNLSTNSPVLVSAWQLGMRTRQMMTKTGTRTRK